MTRRLPVPVKIRAAFLCGPLDGDVRELDAVDGTAPWFVVVPSGAVAVSDNGAAVIHRYRRATDCGGYRGMQCWTYEHEGSVKV